MTDIKCYVRECKFYKDFKCTSPDALIDRDGECLTFELSDEARKELANFGKAESEGFPQAEDIEPTVKGFVDTMNRWGDLVEEGGK